LLPPWAVTIGLSAENDIVLHRDKHKKNTKTAAGPFFLKSEYENDIGSNLLSLVWDETPLWIH
jgi:hypothetical protein